MTQFKYSRYQCRSLCATTNQYLHKYNSDLTLGREFYFNKKASFVRDVKLLIDFCAFQNYICFYSYVSKSCFIKRNKKDTEQNSSRKLSKMKKSFQVVYDLLLEKRCTSQFKVFANNTTLTLLVAR